MERKKFTARETRLANWTNKFDFFYGQMIPDWKRMRFGFNEIILWYWQWLDEFAHCILEREKLMLDSFLIRSQFA